MLCSTVSLTLPQRIQKYLGKNRLHKHQRCHNRKNQPAVSNQAIDKIGNGYDQKRGEYQPYPGYFLSNQAGDIKKKEGEYNRRK
jgi:hypothetical protein